MVFCVQIACYFQNLIYFFISIRHKSDFSEQEYFCKRAHMEPK